MDSLWSISTAKWYILHGIICAAKIQGLDHDKVKLLPYNIVFVLLVKTYVLRKSIFGPVLSRVVYLMREILMVRLHDSRTDQTRTRWVGGKGRPLYHPRYTDSRLPEQGKQFTLYIAKVFFFFVLLDVYSQASSSSSSSKDVISVYRRF